MKCVNLAYVACLQHPAGCVLFKILWKSAYIFGKCLFLSWLLSETIDQPNHFREVFGYNNMLASSMTEVKKRLTIFITAGKNVMCDFLAQICTTYLVALLRRCCNKIIYTFYSMLSTELTSSGNEIHLRVAFHYSFFFIKYVNCYICISGLWDLLLIS